MALDTFSITLGNKQMFSLVIIIPIILFLHFYFLTHSKRRALKFSNFEAMKRVEGSGHKLTKYFTPLFFAIIIILLLIMAALDITVWRLTDVSSSDYYVLLDSGASMTARDIYPDRQDLAKKTAKTLIDRLNNSEIGFISFSGTIDQNIMLTNDKNLLKNAVDDSKISNSGTDIGLAIISGINGLSVTNKSKTIVLISDGHDTAGIPLSYAIRNAQEQHINILTLGIGTLEGGTFLEIPNTPQMISRLDETTLKMISNATESAYFRISSEKDLEEVFSKIDINKQKGYVSYDLTTPFILAALTLFFFSWIMESTRFRIFP